MPERQKINNGGLDQYGPERLGTLIFATIRKKCENERVKVSMVQMHAEHEIRQHPCSKPSDTGCQRTQAQQLMSSCI